MNLLNNFFVDFSNLHVFQVIKDLAWYDTFSRCVKEIRSSKFRGHGSCLDEPPLLNYFCFTFVVMSSEHCIILIG
ncbi:hypothetical protein HanRHA438_Chr14g0639541 [Helianthus annuus]|nr:hypothetical protein HanRHA438_Chr14g0639541 [Helianthus annuus]